MRFQLLITLLIATATTATAWEVQPFTIDLISSVPHMLSLIGNTHLPSGLMSPNRNPGAGISLDTLTTLRHKWLHDFSWPSEQQRLNALPHYTTSIEGLNIHFIQAPSPNSGAIPLLLLHGWPGSFLEFVPVIRPLTQAATTSSGRKVSFHVVILSLPGFAFSGEPPEGWTVNDTARVANTLMTEVLGYERYAVHGTDWGSGVAYQLYANFSSSVHATHLCFLPFAPLSRAQLAARNIMLSPLEEFEQSRQEEWLATGTGYFVEQTTKPNTLGLALHDNPVGQLAWIGEKMLDWSDPRAGTPPSLLSYDEILRSVSLYHLSETFLSSVSIYHQNPTGFRTNYTRPVTDTPLLFSSFKYNVGFWPPAVVAEVGDLVRYTNHEFGGHFPGLDNPDALVEDLREIGQYWIKT